MHFTIAEMARRCRLTDDERTIHDAWAADEAMHAKFDRIQNGLCEDAITVHHLDPIALAASYDCPVPCITAMLKFIYVTFVLAARGRIPGYHLTAKGRKLVNSESLERYIQQLPDQGKEA
jgi:hypothetical protein